MSEVAIRYPLAIRYGAALVSVLLAASTASRAVGIWTIVIAGVAVWRSVAVLAYEGEVDLTEVRGGYLPFFTNRTPMRDVMHLVEETTLVLVTATSKIPLWGLSLKAREPLFAILPRHLEVLPTLP